MCLSVVADIEKCVIANDVIRGVVRARTAVANPDPAAAASLVVLNRNAIYDKPIFAGDIEEVRVCILPVKDRFLSGVGLPGDGAEAVPEGEFHF
jgi:hypothetical protein